MKLKNNLPLVMAIAIPVLLMIFMMAIIYIPQQQIKPVYNFLYLAGGEYWNQYPAIKDNRLVIPSPPASLVPDSYYSSRKSNYYIYQPAKDESRKITEEEAKQLKLLDQPVSPDGYSVGRNTDNTSFGILPLILGVTDSSKGIYLKNKQFKKRISVEAGLYNYDFRFIGWILP